MGVYLQIMLQLGFSAAWVIKVMNCFGSTSFSILINVREGSRFSASRGLHQGCPLSPFLFIICAEGFSTLINDAILRGSVQGFQVARVAPSISHLFFVDDSLLFVRVDIYPAMSLRRATKAYEVVSGQKVNFQKLFLCFSPNVELVLTENVKVLLRLRV